MPVVTNRLSLVHKLLADPPAPGTMRRLIRQASVDMILAAPTTKSELKAAAAQGKVELANLERFIDALVLSNKEGQAEDRKISRTQVDSLEELFDSEDWQSALEHHSGATIPGETRDAYFGRSFGNLVSENPNEVRVLDRYFLSKTIKKEEVVGWLVSQLASRAAGSLTVWTGVVQDQQLIGTRTELARQFAREILKVVSDAEFLGSVNLFVFDSHLHDRYFYFRFSESGVAFSLGAGIDVFRSHTLSEMSVANPISSTDLKNILSSSRLRPSSEYQFKEAAIDGLPENIKLMIPDSW